MDTYIGHNIYDTILSILFASICIILIDGGKVVPSNHPGCPCKTVVASSNHGTTGRAVSLKTLKNHVESVEGVFFLRCLLQVLLVWFLDSIYLGHGLMDLPFMLI